MSWKLPVFGLVGSAGLYVLNHRLGGAALVATMIAVFLAAVFGDTSSPRCRHAAGPTR